MANVTISQSVGVRRGSIMMPNLQSDLDRVTALFDAIPPANGGTQGLNVDWAVPRDLLIAGVTAQIIAFQTANRANLPVIDGVVDPRGNTLRLMNALAGPAPDVGVTATVVQSPYPDYAEEVISPTFQTVDVPSMPGKAALRHADFQVNYVRRLVRIEGSSINWVGVIFPGSAGSITVGKVPHLFFTPLPTQGDYYDQAYDSFGGSPPWWKLWHDYTWGMGRQLIAAGVDQFLVIPFYRNSQHGNLGSFLSNWQDVIAAAVTEAISSVDPYYLRDTFTFDRICSSSFSNGWIPHLAFNSSGDGAARMTDVVFDIDGQAARPPCRWRPSNGVSYLDLPPPRGGNPAASQWYVGGRWKDFYKYWPEGFRSHNACASYLLFHGVSVYCR
jgi:hypothetical protein